MQSDVVAGARVSQAPQQAQRGRRVAAPRVEQPRLARAPQDLHPLHRVEEPDHAQRLPPQEPLQREPRRRRRAQLI